MPEVEDGGLMSFGPDLDESYRRAAALADAILKGARPGRSPGRGADPLHAGRELKTAAALDVIVPPAILVRADKVIE